MEAVMVALRNLIVIGNGMVGHKFLELMVSKEGHQDWNIITFCEESRVAYDRVNLSSYFAEKTAGDLSLVEPGFYQDNGIKIYIGDKAESINREQKKVISANGVEIEYDKIDKVRGMRKVKTVPSPGSEVIVTLPLSDRN